MDIHFNCSRCGQPFSIEERGAGITVKCPLCNEQIEVPRPSESSLADELQKLATLKSQGVLSESEFEAAKKRLLGS